MALQFPQINWNMLTQMGDSVAELGPVMRDARMRDEMAGLIGPDGKISDWGKATALVTQNYPALGLRLQADREGALADAQWRQDQANRPDWQVNPVTGQMYNAKNPNETVGVGATNPYFRGGKETDAQAKAASYGDRATAAYNAIVDAGDIESDDRDISTAAQFLPDGWLKNKLSSDKRQVFNQAADDFVNAINRRDSGQQVSEVERNRALQLFIPRPGDKPEVLARKAQARKVVLEGLYGSAGPNYQPPPMQEAPAQVEVRRVPTQSVAPDGTMTPTAQANAAPMPDRTQGGMIPPQAVQYLKAHPESAPFFEQKYGVSAKAYLGQ